MLHSAGLVNIVCFRSVAAKSLRLVDQDDGNVDIMVNRMAISAL